MWHKRAHVAVDTSDPIETIRLRNRPQIIHRKVDETKGWARLQQRKKTDSGQLSPEHIKRRRQYLALYNLSDLELLEPIYVRMLSYSRAYKVLHEETGSLIAAEQIGQISSSRVRSTGGVCGRQLPIGFGNVNTYRQGYNGSLTKQYHKSMLSQLVIDSSSKG